MSQLSPTKGAMKNIPNGTTAQMIEVDRAMIEDFHIELTHMMEGGILPPRRGRDSWRKIPQGNNLVVLAGTDLSRKSSQKILDKLRIVLLFIVVASVISGTQIAWQWTLGSSISLIPPGRKTSHLSGSPK